MKKKIIVIALISLLGGILIFISFLSARYSEVFKKLSVIQEYAEKVNEFPDADNISQILDWLNPEYKTFHIKHRPTFFSRMLATIGLNWPRWTIEGFKELLQEVTSKRQTQGLEGRFVQKIVPFSESNFFIWGNLHGAFHSLVRDLVELENLGVIDDSLNIINKDHYFIFIGNIIDRSASVLETVTLVLRLMQKNPGRVIYIKGDHEYQDNWINYCLRRELQLRAGHISAEDIPLKSEIDLFFGTLPLAVYLVSKENLNSDLVLISSIIFADERLHMNVKKDFFTSDYALHHLGEDVGIKSKNDVDLKAVIRTKRWSLSAAQGELWGTEYYPYGGLHFLGILHNVAEWAVLSSPTNTSRRLFNFHYDSFVRLRTKNGVDNWKLTVYNRDIREHDAKFKKQSLDLIPGKQGLEAKEIKDSKL